MTADNGNHNPCLHVEGVRFRHTHFELAPVSFAASPGEVVAIIGPNGSGKSTLLGIVSGYLKPLSGRVSLDRKDLHSLPLRQRAQRVGLARQDSPLLFAFEVREFVRQGRHAHLGHRLFETSDDEKWVDWAIHMMDLNDLTGRKVTEISGGEFQRAVLARTLVQRPRLVLLDEPTANLDIRYQIEMLQLLRRLATTENFASVIVTHELSLAAQFADHLLLLEQGRCVCQGPPDRVLEADLLSRVFQTPVLVGANPTSGRPHVTWAVQGTGYREQGSREKKAR